MRLTEVDKVEIYKCFRPNDIVKAEVISLGDSRSYFLSTAKNELGVIFAKSVAGTYLLFSSHSVNNIIKVQQWCPSVGIRCSVQRPR